MVTTGTDEALDHAERWFRDGLRVLQPALSVHQITVEMTQALRRVEELRRTGVPASTTHLLVQAVARALAANPGLHQIVAGTKRHRPETVDIGLSVSGESFVAPVLVLKSADRKTVAEIASEIAQRVPAARQGDERFQRTLRRWGWLVPLGILRRALLRLCYTSPSFRRRAGGTFQVSTTPTDWALTSTFATAGVLVAGQVVSRVIVIDGQAAVRPTMILTLSGDHGIWDGRAAARFLAAVRAELDMEHTA